MTLIGEVSAQTFAEAHYGTPCVVTSLDVRYLIGGRSGPLVTQAEWIGDPDSGTIKVDLRDEGHDILHALSSHMCSKYHCRKSLRTLSK